MSAEIEDLKAAVWELGPLVTEFFQCSTCGFTEFASHPFCESVSLSCGHREVSKVTLYDHPDGFGE